MPIKTNSSSLLPGENCSFLLNFIDVLFRTKVLHLPKVVYSKFAICGQKNCLSMESYIPR